MTAEDSHEPSVLVAGKRFHRDVQAAYVAGLVGVELSDAAELTFVRVSGKRGRADILLIVANEPERMQFVVEIKVDYLGAQNSSQTAGAPPAPFAPYAGLP